MTEGKDHDFDQATIRAGETNALPRDMTRHDAISHWTGAGHMAFVADAGSEVLGT